MALVVFQDPQTTFTHTVTSDFLTILVSEATVVAANTFAIIY